MSAVEVVSLGCRLNIAEGEAIRARLAGTRDLVVVNGCAVTAEAVKSTRAAIRRTRRARPEARIVLTGCVADTEPAAFAGLAEIVPNGAKLDPLSYLPSSQRTLGSQEAERTPREIPAFAGVTVGEKHARVFLPVQNGCDHRCTFCIIPYGRGPSRSFPAGGVVEEVRKAVDAGVQEVVLTGVDLTAYGADLPGAPTLGRLVERILAFVPDLPRLRLSSLDPCEVDDRLAALIAHEPRVMPHLHLSLQAGDDLILKRMKRRHSRAQAVALVARLKALRPELAIGADLIAGFPTEDDAMAANSLALIDACDIVFAHIFPYSPRAGTPAARMPQVAPAIVRARAAALRAAAETRRAAWLQERIGTVQRVLVELDGVTGHAENFARVRLAYSPSPLGGEGRGEGLARAASMAASAIEVGTISDARVPPPNPLPQGERAFPNRIVDTRIVAVEGDMLIGAPA
ncbi:tRNA (N(6)-L-threonylcarbamoyladenosine(37)-C(2))-methylthiotransferase MtaB [Sphingomonas nostoxanthinifaciens]|uniref:tRNA (N(6)-L-threonylcarbamoyladenosine(37)-C(2))- methylthiotransferase MtaB n=1 Tax=Sphingomonas nostoxanthinifaciens TaxID=2872652 RepID=UPI001CC1DF1C|nr:tRNA (N(6)-L-threonylcarbamoyladenosine(37)-C(2))-methylthiotransferase MtaB [Sphingomonas nostoxanthinifaciens]UAK24833.1 tRNA (N(6)-L-threonylcarbamoyladenosine(37)-C(2))-methylthiotransferase MtaB [Sphingomonas nostoxanthinifaciens]